MLVVALDRSRGERAPGHMGRLMEGVFASMFSGEGLLGIV